MALRELLCRCSLGTGEWKDRRRMTVAKAVLGFIGNLIFAFYNAVLGLLSGSVIFLASAAYYLLLSAMRFAAVMLRRNNEEAAACIIGSLLVALSGVFPVIVFFSMSQNTAESYGTIPMITIATYTFTKITMAGITAVKHRKNASRLIWAINAIRYSEVAVSLMTMQQSMLVSFAGDREAAVILNAFTGAGVCLFILAMGIATIHYSGKK